MPAVYALVQSIRTGKTQFAIAADETQARYVFRDGEEWEGLDDDRARMLVDEIRLDEYGAITVLTAAARGLGYSNVAEPVDADTLEAAEAAAREALSAS